MIVPPSIVRDAQPMQSEAGEIPADLSALAAASPRLARMVADYIARSRTMRGAAGEDT